MGAYKLKDAQIQCMVGTTPGTLKMSKDHGVFSGGTPLANANDHLPNVNIAPFGTCAIKTAAASGVPQPCVPITPLAWQLTNPKYMIEGAPVLTDSSMCMCMCGGVIKFT